MVVRDWYITLRAANLPTTWSNVILGAGLSGSALEWPVLVVVAAVSCLYLGGMALNDAIDVRFDRANESTRPVAAGRISPTIALGIGSMLMVVGFVLGALAETGPNASQWTMEATFILVILVYLYQWLHRHSALLAAMVMAGCRGTVPIVAALAVDMNGPSPVIWVAAACVAIWTGGITLIGRGERGGEPRARGGIALLVLAALGVLPVALLAPSGDLVMAAVGLLIVLVAWVPAVARQYAGHGRGAAVCWAIAGLSVLDCGLLLSVQEIPWAAAAMICGVLSLGLQRLGGGT